MRHLYDKVHLNRTKSHRRALFSNLSSQLFTHRRIMTTLAKAKYTRRYAERMITFARKGDVAARRHVLRFITDKQVVKALFDELGPHFKNRNGGYTRIIKLGPRQGDAAPMALLELVGFDDVSVQKTKTKTKSRLKDAQKAAVADKEDISKKTDKKTEPKVEEPVVDGSISEETEDQQDKQEKS